MIYTVLRILYDFLSLKNDVNVPSKRINQNKLEKILFFVGVLKVRDWRKEQDPNPEPDPLVRGTNPRIRIRTKMSQIQNTAFNYYIRSYTPASLRWLTQSHKLILRGRASLRPVLFSLVDSVNSKLELYAIQWYENPVFVFRNSMSSDGELSAIGKKEWEKRLKVKAGKPVYRIRNRIRIWSGFNWVSGSGSRQAKIIPRRAFGRAGGFS